jgi:hypothetical protein
VISARAAPAGGRHVVEGEEADQRPAGVHHGKGGSARAEAVERLLKAERRRTVGAAGVIASATVESGPCG